MNCDRAPGSTSRSLARDLSDGPPLSRARGSESPLLRSRARVLRSCDGLQGLLQLQIKPLLLLLLLLLHLADFTVDTFVGSSFSFFSSWRTYSHACRSCRSECDWVWSTLPDPLSSSSQVATAAQLEATLAPLQKIFLLARRRGAEEER